MHGSTHMVTPEIAAAFLNLGLWKVREMMDEGTLRSVTVSTRRWVSLDDVKRVAAELQEG